MKHTPAPWHKADSRQVKRGDGSIIATAWYFGNKGCVSKEEAEANNHLIAAAPDMYNLLKELRETVNLAAVEMIDKVLSKAEGNG